MKKNSGTRKYQKDYNLSKINDRKKYIDAINKRVKQTFETFGGKSSIYKKLKSKLTAYMSNDPEMLKEKDNGLVYLSKNKKYVEDKKNFTILERQNFIDKPTVKEYLNTTLQKMKERGEIDKDVTLRKYISADKAPIDIQGAPTKDGQYPVINVKEMVIEYSKQINDLQESIRDDFTYLYGHEDDEEIADAINTLHIQGRRKTIDEMIKIDKAINKVKTMFDDEYPDF